MNKFITFVTCALLSFNVLADKQEDRQEVLDMRADVLAKLYKEEPDVKDKIAEAKGYAVFSNIGINLVFFSAGDHTGKPSCATNGTGTWAIDTSTGGGRAMYAAILTALAIEKSITVEGYGTGVCDRESSRESARFFYFSEQALIQKLIEFGFKKRSF